MWKAIRVNPSTSRNWEQDPAEAVMLDGAASGQTFDWKIAVSTRKKIIVAGGLDATRIDLRPLGRIGAGADRVDVLPPGVASPNAEARGGR